MGYVAQILNDYETHEDNSGTFYVDGGGTFEIPQEINFIDGVSYHVPDYLRISAIGVVITPYDIVNCDLPYIT